MQSGHFISDVPGIIGWTYDQSDIQWSPVLMCQELARRQTWCRGHIWDDDKREIIKNCENWCSGAMKGKAQLGKHRQYLWGGGWEWDKAKMRQDGGKSMRRRRRRMEAWSRLNPWAAGVSACPDRSAILSSFPIYNYCLLSIIEPPEPHSTALYKHTRTQAQTHSHTQGENHRPKHFS